MGKKDGDHGATTDFDPTDKPITPMGGFVGYGEVNEDYLIIKVLIRPLPFSTLSNPIKPFCCFHHVHQASKARQCRKIITRATGCDQ